MLNKMFDGMRFILFYYIDKIAYHKKPYTISRQHMETAHTKGNDLTFTTKKYLALLLMAKVIQKDYLS